MVQMRPRFGLALPRNAPEDMAVYPIQWRHLEDAVQKLEPNRWIPRSSVKGNEASHKRSEDSPLVQ